MQKDSKPKCNSSKHKQLKDNAKTKLDELQNIFANIQYARREGQDNTILELEEQANQVLVNWKTELNETSSTSSLHAPGSSFGLDSEDIRRLLRLSDEEDDATSPLDVSKARNHNSDILANDKTFHFLNQDPSTNYIPHEGDFGGFNNTSTNYNPVSNIPQMNSQVQYDQFNLQPNAEGMFYMPTNGVDQTLENMLHDFDFQTAITPPTPADYLRSKCALWDCSRPPQNFHDYCHGIHANQALKEGASDMGPVLRPGGINLKDNVLFDVVKAKIQGKEVGIPECDGAVSAKSPWNAPELFDINLCEGETVREWLFFDKPRKAFESGNRKQRSLPDYNGRGWHESRKQVVNATGLKRSYYMDPQPADYLEWHLFEYGSNKCDAFALYRLELKLVDGKKKSKGKAVKDPVASLEKQMGKLTADLPAENIVSTMSMRETSKALNVCSPGASNQMISKAGTREDGSGYISESDDLVDILSDYKYTKI